MMHRTLAVIGAGPAGFCAAVAAARLGVQTVLIEQYGTLGGAMTMGGIPYPMNFAAGGRQIIAGIGWELIQRLANAGWACVNGNPAFGAYRTDLIMTACEMDQMAIEAGVELLLNCKVFSAAVDSGRVTSVRMAAPEGEIELSAEYWIDASGDGQLAALAGAAYEMGDDHTGELQPGTLSFWMDGYAPSQIPEEGADKAYWQARREGRLQVGDYYGEATSGILGLFNGHGLNKNHVTISEVSAIDHTKAALEGRARIKRLLNWIKSSVPAAKDVYGAFLSPQPWARESRRILGMEYITVDEYRTAKKYETGVCCSYYPVDLHQRPEEGKPAYRLESHDSHPLNVASIPLGSMIVRGFSNLLTAGRCISGDRLAQSAYRVQATCMAMGQAAGTAVSVCSAAHGDMRDVDTNAVRAALVAQGAIVPDLP